MRFSRGSHEISMRFSRDLTWGTTTGNEGFGWVECNTVILEKTHVSFWPLEHSDWIMNK